MRITTIDNLLWVDNQMIYSQDDWLVKGQMMPNQHYFKRGFIKKPLGVLEQQINHWNLFNSLTAPVYVVWCCFEQIYVLIWNGLNGE